MRNFAKPSQACRRAIGLRTSYRAVFVVSLQILQRLHTIVSTCFYHFPIRSCDWNRTSFARTHPSLLWEFLLMRLNCNCSELVFDFKLSQPRRPNVSSATGQGHNCRGFFCANRWLNRSNACLILVRCVNIASSTFEIHDNPVREGPPDKTCCLEHKLYQTPCFYWPGFELGWSGTN